MTQMQGEAATPNQPPAIRASSLLVVDDNSMNRIMLSRYISKLGYQAALAENGRQALDKLQTEPFDLVLLDVEMPEMDGYQVLAQLKATARLRDIPVIMISAVEELESVVTCIELGAQDYLPKPFNPVLLRARLTACLERKRLRDQQIDWLRESAVLEERNRLAGEIHDSLAQSFVGISMQLDAAEAAASKAKSLAHIQRANELARFGLAEARRSVLSLRSGVQPGGDRKSV